MSLDPIHYLKFSKIQMGVAAELIAQIGLQGHEQVLDVGSGDGKITAIMHEMAQEAVGVDLCANMVAFSKELFPHIRFYQQDAEEMVFDKAFDLVTCLSALHWVRRPVRAFEKMLLALKPGGRAYILTYSQESIYWRPVQKTAQDPLFIPYQSTVAPVFAAAAYREMAEKAGFSVLSITLEDRYGIHEDLDELKSYIKGWLPSFITLPSHLESQFINLTAQRQLEQAVEKEDGKIHLPYKMLVMVLQKPFV